METFETSSMEIFEAAVFFLCCFFFFNSFTHAQDFKIQVSGLL